MDLLVFEGFGVEKKGVLGEDWLRWRPSLVSGERLVRVLENWFGFGRDKKNKERHIMGRETKWWSVRRSNQPLLYMPHHRSSGS